MIKLDAEEKVSVYIIIEALYKLRKITKESHEQYLKYNKLPLVLRKQLEIIDEIIKNINKIYYL